MATKDAQLVHEQCESAIVLMTDNTTTVNSGPAYLVGIWVNVALDANDCEIENVAGTSVMTLPASTAAGTHIPCHGLLFPDALIINPADAAASGEIVVFYRKVNPDANTMA